MGELGLKYVQTSGTGDDGGAGNISQIKEFFPFLRPLSLLLLFDRVSRLLLVITAAAHVWHA